MGNNCGSEDAGRGHRAFLRNGSSSDPKFRVYIHRRARVIHAWLVIFPDAIQLELEKNSNVTNWPLQFIRRYGYTSAGIFFFESGRRCPTGEGFHCFQTQYADQVFRLVQERVHATVGSDQPDGTNSRRSVPPESSIDSAKINPLQRFPSEGTSVMSDYRPPSAAGGSWSPSSASAYKMRKVVLPPAPRPRSVSDLDDRGSLVLPKHGTSVGDKIVGNIISMSHNPSVSDESANSSIYGNDETYVACRQRPIDPVIPSYVNISPTGGGDLAFMFTRTRTNSSSSLGSVLGSVPTTPTSKVFSMKWDGGGGSTNVVCHMPLPSTSDYANCGPTAIAERQASHVNYVNVQMTSSRPVALRETTPILNYVDVHTDSPASTLTRPRRPETALPPNYTLIDPEKTKALQNQLNLATERRLNRARDDRKPLGVKVDSS